MGIKENLENAIKSSEPIKIKYNGGSQPGSIREIIPTKLVDNKIYAFCMATGMNKSFILDKIEIVDTITTAEYDPKFISEFEFKEEEGLHPIYNKFINIWLEYGWHVEMNEKSICLFRKWKNGNPQKNPCVCIKFEEEIYPGRPWVSGGAYFKNFGKAVEKFIEKSKTISPTPRKK